MVAAAPDNQRPDSQRIVITGVGLTAPNGNTLTEFREALLAGRSGVRPYEIRYVGANAGRRLQVRRAELSEEERRSPRHPGRQRRHLLRQRGDRRRRARLAQHRQGRRSASTSA